MLSKRILILLCVVYMVANGVLAHGDEHVIEMVEGGFSPTSVEIVQGETVIFRNLDKTDRWPASNIHPTHEIYPEFDPMEPLAPGESWSFTFNKAGEWKFHDHIYASYIGTIRVNSTTTGQIEVSKAERKSLSINDFWERIKIFGLKTYYSVFKATSNKKLKELDQMKVASNKQELSKWLSIFGPERIMADLLDDSGGGTTVDCHQQAHEIGRAAYVLYGAEVFEVGDASCHSGFYHGAMESFLQTEGTTDLAAKINDICEKFESSFGKFECLHGVGHGLLAYEGYDLPATLLRCKELSDTWSTNSCYGGVFMENIVAAQGLGASDHETAWANRTEPYFPCNKVSQEGSVQYECYQMQTSWMLTIYNNDFDKVAKACLNAPKNMVPVCFKSFGRDAAGHSLRNPDEIIRICDKVEGSSNYNECIYGALNVIVDFWGEKLLGQGSELCTKVPNDTDQQGCYSLLASRLANVFIDSNRHKAVCQTFEPKYQNLCANL
jgi:hypothetical protein